MEKADAELDEKLDDEELPQSLMQPKELQPFWQVEKLLHPFWQTELFVLHELLKQLLHELLTQLCVLQELFTQVFCVLHELLTQF